MVNLQEWEQQLQQELAAVRRDGQQLAAQAAAVRGHHETRGVLIEVDATGNITGLQIAPSAMRWTNDQLSAVLLDCHHKARADAESKIAHLIDRASSRIRDQLTPGRNNSTTSECERRAISEDEIQASDDAYYIRRNLYDGWTKQP